MAAEVPRLDTIVAPGTDIPGALVKDEFQDEDESRVNHTTCNSSHFPTRGNKPQEEEEEEETTTPRVSWADLEGHERDPRCCHGTACNGIGIKGNPPGSWHIRNNTNISNITLEDIRQQTPRESEAETYILKALEERDPTTTSSSRHGRVSTRRSRDGGGRRGVLKQTSAAFLNVDASSLDRLANNTNAISSDREGESTDDDYDDDEAEERYSNIRAVRISRMISRQQMSRYQKRRPRLIDVHESTYEKLKDLTSAMDEIESDFSSNSGTEETIISTTTPKRDYSFYGNTKFLSRLHTKRNLTGGVNDDDEQEDKNNNATSRRKSSHASSAFSFFTSVQTSIARESAMSRLTSGSPMLDQMDQQLESMEEGSEENNNNNDRGGRKKKRFSKKRSEHQQQQQCIRKRQIFQELEDYWKQEEMEFIRMIRLFILFFVFPLILLAILFYYAFGNPGGGSPDDPRPSVSWWILFVLRQLLMGLVAKFLEFLLIDFFSSQSQASVQMLGPGVILFIMSSRGWPFLLSTWGILDLFFLANLNVTFSSHWLFYQDTIGLFNESNPSGNVVESKWNIIILSIAVVLGVVVTIKRFCVGLFLGRRTYIQHSGRLAALMKKILLVSEVAALSQKLERIGRVQKRFAPASRKLSIPCALSANNEGLEELMADVQSAKHEADVTGCEYDALGDIEGVIDPLDRHPLTGSLSSAQKARIVQLLGAWGEPQLAETVSSEPVTVEAILHFHRALAFLQTPNPFGRAFGLATFREECIESAQALYWRLVGCSNFATESGAVSNSQSFDFEVIALLTVQEDGNLDSQKAKDLIKIFRPHRDGLIDAVSFVKSIDAVYKELRLLRAAVANSSKIDSSIQAILNVIFYAIVMTTIVIALEKDPEFLWWPLTVIFFPLAFVLGGASSDFFKGLVFVVARRPYEVGDCIHASDPASQSSPAGNGFWAVEDVDLLTTKVVFFFTGEKASLSNGSLANLRIINSTKSKNAYLHFMIKFPVNVSYKKLKQFKDAVEQFVFNRPKEWLSSVDIRATSVAHDLGYIDYMVGLQHRGSWVDWGEIFSSKADLMLFCNELQKKLGIHFTPPPLSVNLATRTPVEFPPLNTPGQQHQGPLTQQGPIPGTWPPLSFPGQQHQGAMTQHLPMPDVPDQGSFSTLDAMFPIREPTFTRSDTQ